MCIWNLGGEIMLDERDKIIFEMFIKDVWILFVEIVKVFGISEMVVRKRVKVLEEVGVIK